MKRKTFIYLGVALLFLVTSFAFKYAHPGEDLKQIMTIVEVQRIQRIYISTPTETKFIDIKKNEPTVLSTVSDYQKQGWVVKSSNIAIDQSLATYYFYMEK